jgi:hypothetical protein
MKLFELVKEPEPDSRLSDIDNAFWLRPDVKQEVVNFLVMQHTGETKVFDMETKSGNDIKLSFQGKVIEGVPGNERKLLVMIKQAD